MCLSVVREGVHDRVGGGVVALARRCDDRPGRPEHHEKLQIASLESVVQHTGTLDFRLHHPGEIVFGHIDQETVIDSACGVDDSAYRSAAIAEVIAQPVL